MKRVLGPGATCDCDDGCCELCCPEELTVDMFEDTDEESAESLEEDE